MQKQLVCNCEQPSYSPHVQNLNRTFGSCENLRRLHPCRLGRL